MNGTKTDESRFTGLYSKLKIALHHPQLAVHFYEGEAKLSRRHVEIELGRAITLYSKLLSTKWDSERVIRTYLSDLGCYGNSYLYAVCRHFRPSIVVETGVHYGGSSAFILQALRDNDFGQLYSIDLPNQSYIRDNGTTHHDSFKHKHEQVGFAVPSLLRGRWTLLLGDAKEELPKLLRTLDSIDIFHHDSMHTYEHMYLEYKLAWSKLKGGGLLLSDDIEWNTAFIDFCREKGIQPHVVNGKGFVEKP